MNEDEPYSPEQRGRPIDAGDIYLNDDEDDGDFHDVHIAPAPSLLLKPDDEDTHEFSSVGLSVARNKHEDEEEADGSISEECRSGISSSSNLDS